MKKREQAQNFSADSLHREAGFSLTELAVYIVLLGIVASIVATVVVTSFRSEQTVSSATNIANAAQTAFAQLDRDARNSRSVTPDSGVTDTLTLCVASTDAVVTWQPITWAIEDHPDGTFTVTRQEHGGPQTRLLGDPDESGGVTVKSANFSIVSGTVNYVLTLTSGASAEQTFEGAVSLSPVVTSEASCP